jgi:hypothetical protein
LATGTVVGRLSPDGRVTSDDAGVIDRIEAAFQRELIVQDGTIVDELGLCYADVETLCPGDPRQIQLVLRNLAALTGLLPRSAEFTYTLTVEGDATLL